jgi:hypothetical protein
MVSLTLSIRVDGVNTLVFEENTTLRDNDWHIAINEALALVVGQGNGDIGVLDADVEWNAKNTADLRSYMVR